MVNKFKKVYRFFRLELLLSIVFLLTSCQKEVNTLLESNLSSVEAQGPSINLSFSALESTDINDEMRSVDFIALETQRNGETVIRPRLDAEQFHKESGIPVQILLVSDDASQPVNIVETQLYPLVFNSQGRIVNASEVYPDRYYVRTMPGRGNHVTLRPGTDLTRGHWRMALLFGGQQQNWTNGSSRSLRIDPNRLNNLGEIGPEKEDNTLAEVYDKDKSNLKGIPAVTRRDSYTDSEKVALDVPFFSEWKELSSDQIVTKNGTTWINAGSFSLRPQGTLFRLQVKNEDFADINWAGIRILTNSFAFRGEYQLTDDNIRNFALGNKALPELWKGYKAMRWEPLTDSISRTLAYPNPADFFFSKSETEVLRTGQNSSKHILIWAMPQRSERDPSKSREGILHVLLYDKNRTDTKYNRSRPYHDAGAPLTPIGLIRKPAYTKSFTEGHLTISTEARRGESFRLNAMQTKIYNFLDFVSEDKQSDDYLNFSAMQNASTPEGYYIPEKKDWAMIFPTKLADYGVDYDYYGYRDNRHYFGKISNLSNKSFNSNGFGQEAWGDEYIGHGNGQVNLIIDNNDSGYIPMANTPENLPKAGKQNNKHIVRIPKEMLVPVIRSGQRINTIDEERALNFSTYQFKTTTNEHYILNGWGDGQTYLTALTYKQNPSEGNVLITARYLGPSFHRALYGSGWANQWPWDISFYLWQAGAEGNPFRLEEDDTQRTIRHRGFIVKNASSPITDTANEDGAKNNATFWSKEGNWLYLYGEGIAGRQDKGFGIPANAKRQPYSTADNPRAPILYFRKTPSSVRK